MAGIYLAQDVIKICSCTLDLLLV